MTLLLYAITQVPTPQGLHYKDGQFYLYAASWLASAVLIFFDRKNVIYDRFAWLCYISAFLLFGVSIIYAFHLAGIVIPDDVKYVTSIWVFIGSIVIFIVANLVSSPTPIDPRVVEKEGIEKIKAELPNG